jgi:hypothetical protein
MKGLYCWALSSRMFSDEIWYSHSSECLNQCHLGCATVFWKVCTNGLEELAPIFIVAVSQPISWSLPHSLSILHFCLCIKVAGYYWWLRYKFLYQNIAILLHSTWTRHWFCKNFGARPCHVGACCMVTILQSCSVSALNSVLFGSNSMCVCF